MADDPSLVHQTDRVRAEIVVGDCIRAIPHHLDPQSADMIFADPPFNLGVAYGGELDSDTRSGENYARFTGRYLRACVNLLRPGGTLALHIPDEAVYPALRVLQDPRMERINWIVRHYRFGQYTATRFIQSHEHLLYYVRRPAKARTWNVRDACEPSVRLRTGDPRTSDSQAYGMRPYLDVWEFPRVQGNNRERRSLHPNQLPEEYVARMIRAVTNPDDLVVDPFVGSGTTGVVAHALQRNFVGFERVPEYAESAMDRVQAGPVRGL